MNKKIIFSCMLSLLLAPVYARDININDLKEKAKQYSNGKGGGAAGKLDDLTAEPPKSRFIDPTPISLSGEDKRHILVHMKLANRHFSKKNYDKAKEEVDKVFQRDSSHSGGHFMLAVIAGRHKDYLPAWYHITIAKEKDNGNNKIEDFIKKLKTVSTQPSTPQWIPGVYKGIETNASERTFDILEKLLSDECSQNITYLENSDYQNKSGNKSSSTLILKARDQFDQNKIISLLKNINNSDVSVEENSNNNLKITLTYNIASEKNDAKAITGINEFINDLTEEMPEIAVSNIDEGEPTNGYQEIIYDISCREFSSLNQFMRRISPFASKYILQSMDLGYIPGSQSTIWKAKVKILYKV